jgi:hypothetical protein
MWAFVPAFAFLYAWGLVIFNGRPPLSSANEPIGGDYVAFYAAGRILQSGAGAHLYDRATVVAVQDAALEGRIPEFYDAFRNPPFLGLVFAPLSVLGLVPSFAVWSAISLAAYVGGVLLLCRMTPGVETRWRGIALIGFAFGPVYFGLINGQNSTVSMLLYVLIYRALVGGNDRAAGVWAALGLFKPQLFFIFPLVFLASRRWQALLSYAATAIVLGIVSFVAVGPDGLVGWFRVLVDLETNNAQKLAWRMHSLKAFFELLLPAQPTLAWLLYGLGMLGLLALLWRAWAQSRIVSPALWILTSLIAVLVDPHLVDYDLTVLIPAGVLAVLHMPATRLWILLLYPLLVIRAQLPLGESSVQVTTAVLLFLCALVLRVPLADAGALRRSPPPVPARAGS